MRGVLTSSTTTPSIRIGSKVNDCGAVGIRAEGAGRRGTIGGATGRVPCRVISRSWYCCSENGSPRRSMRYFASNQLGAATFHCAPRRHTGMNLRSLREVNTSPVMMLIAGDVDPQTLTPTVYAESRRVSA